MDESLRPSLQSFLNKIRNWYDNKEVELHDDVAISFHVEILVFLRNLVALDKDGSMFGVSTAKFLTELLRNFISALDIAKTSHKPVLNKVLHLLVAMLDQTERNHDIWRLLFDAKEEVYGDVFVWFLESDRNYSALTSNADTETLNILAGIIEEMPEAVDRPFAKIFHVLNTVANYESQRTAYTIARSLTREFVHTTSLRIEMGVAKSSDTTGCLPQFILDFISVPPERGIMLSRGDLSVFGSLVLIF
jgi:hypothetical protein